MLRLRVYRRLYRYACAVLLFVLLLESAATVIGALARVIPYAEAAVVVIEGSPNTDGPSHTAAGSQTVFISDQVGYKFFRSSGGGCQYRKTLNGGSSWGSAVTVDSQTDCVGVVVWYDQWTPGDTGSYIHIATLDTNPDSLFYNRLDTTNDSLLLVTAVDVTPASPATYTSATNRVNITKASTGEIYITADDGGGTEIVSCSTSCSSASNWSDVGTPPQGNADSWSMLMPLAAGQMMLVNRSTGNLLRYSIWNGSSWSSMINIDASAVRGTVYDVNMAMTLDTDSGDIYLAYVTDANDFTTADHDIRTAVYSGGSWTNTTSVVTNSARGIHQVALSRNQNNGDIYLVYTARTTIGTAATTNVYWHRSTNGMSSWGAENGPVNSLAGDFYAIDTNIMSFERIYASWFDNVAAVRDIFGETIADIAPDVLASATGTQNTPVRAETNDFYTGGTFSLVTTATRTVSTVVISESGTVNAEQELDNIRLYYEYDTSAPYNCASESYGGGETQFGGTETEGFSGADGTASFTNTPPVSFSPSEALCLYVVLDVLATANDGGTLEVYIADPEGDVVVSDGAVYPATALSLASTTTIVDPELTQAHYHWRLDNGSETSATSATGGAEDTPLTALQKNTPRRLRIGVSNEGSTTSLPVSLQLEYGLAAPSCTDTTSWSVVDTGADWNMYDSTNLTNGTNTTNISVGGGGVTDENITFLAVNTGVRDLTASTSLVTLGTTVFTELEYSIIASSSASEGETYCFRVTRSGVLLGDYLVYPQATIASDVTVQATGTQATSTEVGAIGFNQGGVFRFVENVGSREVTGITLTENGSVDAETDITNIRLRYESDTSAPYDCGSVAYSGTEPQFGLTASSFDAADGIASFTDSVTVSTTSALCVYVVYDVAEGAVNNETINIVIASPASDVLVNGGGSVGPSTMADVSGTTIVRGSILTQTGYHWRLNNGNETTASSATNGLENTALADFTVNNPIRLRLGVVNDGATSTPPTALRLEYGLRITTCDNVSVWTDVGASADAWDMNNTSLLTDGDDTTNIATTTGGVTDRGLSFLANNNGVRDTLSHVSTTTYASAEFTELEFSLTATDDAAYESTYCFRLTANGAPLPIYETYAELTTAPKRDFKIQRGVTTVTGTTTTIFAGIDYAAPSSTDRAFIRITNMHDTGAGRSTGGTTQNADDVTAYISDPGNIMTSITFRRPLAAQSNTRVSWEIIEFVGETGTDNEMIVRNVGVVSFLTASVTASSSVVSGVASSSDVVVFVTGSQNRGTTQNYYASQFTSEWSSSTQRAVFRRDASATTLADLSYAVVEFVGQNWSIQRVEHAYATSSAVETENITPVNSLAKTFLYVQKRMGAQNQVINYGHEVWLSSIGAVSFRLEPNASVAISQVSVAWVIENIQTNNGAMSVQRSNGNTTGGTAPVTLSINIPTAIEAMNNSSIFGNARAAGANTSYPNPHAGLRITSTSTFELWRSGISSLMTYRVEIVEWPVSDLAIRQNYYRFYVHNNALTPTDPWPPGPLNLDENATLAIGNEPLGRGDQIRVRMSLRTSNANMQAGLRAFKLQYGLRVTTCTAIDEWTDTGTATSSTIWRGFIATGTSDGISLSGNPPNDGELLLSVSTVGGTLAHQNPTAANPYVVVEGEDVEYDWHLEHNGANPRSTYCFRMVQSDGTLLDGYLQHPQIRTAGYNPVTQNWRWYSDILSETPVAALASENTAPIDVGNNDTVALRVAVGETKNVSGSDIRFRLQFSDDATFLNPLDVVATSSCTETSLWCYSSGAVIDHATVTTATLSDVATCTSGVGDGCGRHVSSGTYYTGHEHPALTAQEHAFTLRQANARVKAVYYFRLFDVVNNEVVPLGSGESYPSLVTEGPTLVLGVSGLPSGTTTSGITTDATSTPSGVGFGSLALNTDYEAAHRLSITTNATEGYQVYFYARQQLLNSSGDALLPIAATNSSPVAWTTGCPLATSTSCTGYHTTDATLRGGSTRFAPTDSYAGLSTTPQEIMWSSVPANESHDVVYRVRVGELQPAGDYESEIVYLAIPTF